MTAPALTPRTRAWSATSGPRLTGRDRREFTADPATLPAARSAARRFFASWRLPEEVVEDAQLIVSEMGSNAITHSAAASYTLTLTRLPRTLTLTVTHETAGPTVPTRRHPGPQDEHGRGLAIIATLASTWGVAQHDGLTHTWARLAHSPGPRLP